MVFMPITELEDVPIVTNWTADAPHFPINLISLFVLHLCKPYRWRYPYYKPCYVLSKITMLPPLFIARCDCVQILNHPVLPVHIAEILVVNGTGACPRPTRNGSIDHSMYIHSAKYNPSHP
jgi:hypothetical protein